MSALVQCARDLLFKLLIQQRHKIFMPLRQSEENWSFLLWPASPRLQYKLFSDEFLNKRHSWRVHREMRCAKNVDLKSVCRYAYTVQEYQRERCATPPNESGGEASKLNVLCVSWVHYKVCVVASSSVCLCTRHTIKRGVW
jgi:hypothetical protein